MKVLAGLLTVVALVLAGLAARLAVRPDTLAPVAAPAAATYPVVVTARAVAAGHPLAAADVRVERLSVRPAGAYADPAGAIGQRAVIDLGAGVPVLQSLTSTGLARRVAAGERAVAVRVDETIGIGHRVRPGDRVDLFLMLKQDSREIGYTQARLLLPALRVLGYGNESIDGPSHAGDAPQAESQQRRDTARTAVLAVPLEQVNQLLLGAGSGQLAMALRHPDDKAQPSPAFMALPTALPLPRQREEALAPADRAAAGLRLEALAGHAISAAPPARATQVRASAPALRSTAPRPRRTQAAPTAAQAPQRIEILRPAGRETISY